MAGVPAARVVAVVAELDTEFVQLGSGYLLDHQHVLTAAHCTFDQITERVSTSLQIVRSSDGATADAESVISSRELDLAIITLKQPPWPTEPPLLAATVGRVDRTNSAELEACEAVGYPQWQEDPADGTRGLANLRGPIRTLEGLEQGLLVLRDPVLAGVGSDAAGWLTNGAWSGLSGAATFYGGLLLGVVIEHHPRQGPTGVQIRALDPLLRSADPDCVRLARALGLNERSVLPVAGNTAMERRVLQVSAGRLPLVAECDPIVAGVKSTGYHRAGKAAYVARDIDGALAAALGDDTFVVVLGPAAAGKSRSALHAAQSALPGYQLLQPRARASLTDLLMTDAAGLAQQDVLVWLDDLEQFVGDDGNGLDLDVLTAIQTERPRWRVLATLRTDRREAIVGSESTRARTLSHLLAAGRIVTFPTLLSNDERVRAELAYPDEDFSGGVGIGEQLIAGPELLARLEGAANPLGWALCRAAIDLELVGRQPPYDEAELASLSRPYLAVAHPSTAVEASSLPAALAWAQAPLASHIPLLILDRDTGGLRALDYVVSHFAGEGRQRWVPDEVWTHAVRTAAPSNLARVAVNASAAGQWQHCIDAGNRALDSFDSGRAFLHSLLGRAHHELGENERAVELLSAAVDGDDERARAHALQELGDIGEQQGSTTEAINLFRAAVATRHEHTVDYSIERIAEIQERLGELESAADSWESATQLSSSASGRRAAWLRLAQLRNRLGEHAAEAEAYLRAADEADRAAQGNLLLAGAKTLEPIDPARAEDCYRRILDEDADPEAVGNAGCQLGRLLVSTDPGRAANAYRAAIDRGAGDGADMAALSLATLGGVGIDDEESQRLLQIAVRSSNEHVRAMAELAVAWREQAVGELAAAERRADRILDGLRAASDVANLLSLMELFRQLGRSAEVTIVSEIVRSLGTVDERHIATATGARALAAAGDAEAAIEAFRQLLSELESGPAYDAAALELSGIYLDEGRAEQALTLLADTAADRTDAPSNLRQKLATTYWTLDRNAEAVLAAMPMLDDPDITVQAHAHELIGTIALEQGERALAVEHFEQAAQLAHTHSAAHAHWELARLLVGTPDSTETILAHCREAIALDASPYSDRAALQSAITLDSVGRGAEATAVLTEFLPRAALAHVGAVRYQLGVELQRDQRYGRARLQYEQALAQAVAISDAQLVTQTGDALTAILIWQRERPALVEVYETIALHGEPAAQARAQFELAQLELAEGQLEQGRERLHAVIASDAVPYAGRAWLALAELLAGQGDAAAANTALDKASATSDEWIAERIGLSQGLLYLAAGDSAAATASFRRHLDSPNQRIAGLALLNLGITLISADEPTEAVKVLSRAVEFPDHIVSHLAQLALGDYYNRADPPAAITIYQQLAEDASRCDHTFIAAVAAADLLIDADRLDEADSLAKQAALSPQPNVAAQAAIVLSLVEAKTGRRLSARQRLAGIGQLDVVDELWSIAQLELALLEFEDHDFTASLENFRSVRDRDPDRRERAELGVASALVALGRGEEAFAPLLDLADSDDSEISGAAHLHLGHVYRDRQQLLRAATEYRRAAQLDPAGATGAEAAEALAELG